jgi:hypothetical protein
MGPFFFNFVFIIVFRWLEDSQNDFLFKCDNLYLFNPCKLSTEFSIPHFGLTTQNTIKEPKLRRMRLAGHVARMWKGRKRIIFWFRKWDGRRPLGRPRRIWEDEIIINLSEIGWCVWSGFSWLRIHTDGGLLSTRWWTFWFLRDVRR